MEQNMEWSQLSTGFHAKTADLDQVMSMDGQDRSNVATANIVCVSTVLSVTSFEARHMFIISFDAPPENLMGLVRIVRLYMPPRTSLIFVTW